VLPVATAVAIGSVAGTQAAVRTGTKAVVAGGLLLIAVFYFWVAATTSTTLSYGMLGLGDGEAVVIRNVGGRVSGNSHISR
jgi:hypothetical protein